MLQAFIVTLREGVEASLIVGIIFAFLAKSGRSDLKRVVYAALAAAIVTSVAIAIILSRFQYNQDIFEGFVELVAAVFVITMIWYMQRTARKLKGEIEGKVGTFAASGSTIGLFLFVFLMVLREGVETVLILSAVTLNSSELMSFIGTLAGLAFATVFAVMFIKGSVRINLQRFFRVTTVILYFVAFQLIVSGLHELSENGILPSSQTEMRIIGPIVRNDLFFFVTILALTGLMVLFEMRRRAAEAPAPAATITPADRRKAEWQRRRERFWMSAVYTCSFVFIFLVTAQFIYAKTTTALSPATPITLTGAEAVLPLAQINDDQLHRYAILTSNGTEVRFLLFRKPDGNVVSVVDACQVCGPVGFYKSAQGIICKMCASPVAPQSLGTPGGCNPIPLRSVTAGGNIIIASSDLEALAPRFAKK